MKCPQCGSDLIVSRDYDWGVCEETGYRDAGTYYECLQCEALSTPEEMELGNRVQEEDISQEAANDD